MLLFFAIYWLNQIKSLIHLESLESKHAKREVTQNEMVSFSTWAGFHEHLNRISKNFHSSGEFLIF